jgi:hypothetical protein
VIHGSGIERSRGKIEFWELEKQFMALELTVPETRSSSDRWKCDSWVWN